MPDRRQFLGAAGAWSAATTASTTAPAWAAAPAPRRANEKNLVVGLIGCGGRGIDVARSFAGLDGVEVAYACDPDATRAAAATLAVGRAARSGSKRTPQIVGDLRRVLDDQSVDAVIIATPDHWHAPAAILACNAGKHVYVEKPCSHNLREGRLLVEAARRAKRVVQHGTQSRSDALMNHAVDHLHRGLIGTVMVAKAFNIQKRVDIGHGQPGEPPPRFDYDLWLGPAPFVPFQANRHHYNWHWWYAFGTGDMGNDGVHELDLARWGLGVAGLPTTVAAVGGKYVFDDDQQFPDTQTVIFEYPGDGAVGHRRQLVFEMRIWSPYSPDEGIDNGCTFYGTDGWLLLSKRGVVKAFDRRNKPLPLPGTPAPRPGHQADFVAAIRDSQTPSADIALGHDSASLCHLGNIATRLGRSLKVDPKAESILDDPEAQALTRRTYRDGHWAVPKGV